jgi:bacterioferritin (cytochrome b1)
MELLIYCILADGNRKENLNTILTAMNGISGAGLSAVGVDGISAVVSDILKADLKADRYVALEYAEVIETLAEHFPLLPMRYGSIMESGSSIINMLGRNYPDIRKNLDQVTNKFEFGLKVFCDSAKLQAELLAKSGDEINSPFQPPAETGNSVYRDYVTRKLSVHRLEESRLRYAENVIEEITGFLGGLDALNKFRKMVTESNIIDALFLLDKERKWDLINSIGIMQEKYPALKFVLTGPWPPYSFVDFQVK